MGPAPVDCEVLRLAYKEYGDEIRHYSNVRSSLTVFLLTVALGAFSAYFAVAEHPRYLVEAGHILAAMAIIVCLIFSWRTEKAVLKYNAAWTLLETGAPVPVPFPTPKPKPGSILLRMLKDPMNWLAILVVIAIFHAFTRQPEPTPQPKPSVTSSGTNSQ